MHAVDHMVVVVSATATMGVLLGRTWQYRSPHIAVLLWQSAVVAFGLGLVGMLLGIGLGTDTGDPGPMLRLVWYDGLPAPTPKQWIAIGAGVALACWIAFTVVSLAWHTSRRRTQVRSLLELVGRHDDTGGGVEVLEHPALTAYCVPGWHPRVVVSSGTIATLGTTELRSVLAHERAHARERHDLALLPLLAACRTIGRTRLGRAIRDEVSLLVEMCADEVAARECGRDVLSTALRRFGPRADDAPGGALGATGSVISRCARLDHPPAPLPAWAALVALVSAAALLGTPVWLLVQPM